MREEIDTKKLIPENQTGFRKRKGTLDNIYTLNYLINRQLTKKGGKMVALFVNLKAAFDSANREEIIRGNKGKGSEKGIDRKDGRIFL